MFARVFALLPLALVASASPLVARDNCSNGGIYCCNSFQEGTTPFGFVAWESVIDVPTQVQALVGNQCNPITAIGVGSACQASQQSVCCNNNNQNGLINVGCNPFNVAL